jgi:hypothetical protein
MLSRPRIFEGQDVPLVANGLEGEESVTRPEVIDKRWMWEVVQGDLAVGTTARIISSMFAAAACFEAVPRLLRQRWREANNVDNGLQMTFSDSGDIGCSFDHDHALFLCPG